jgi:hypothetical protein
VREAGVQVNCTPKIHSRDPMVEDHSIFFPDHDLIPLSLKRVFSYFPTSKPTTQILDKCDDLFLLTPEGQWNPHSDAYARNEENMLDWERNIVEKRDQVEILLSEVEIGSTMISSAKISKLETKIIDERMSDLERLYGTRKGERPPWKQILAEVNNIASVLCSVLLVLEPK